MTVLQLSQAECWELLGDQGAGTLDLARHGLTAPLLLPYVVTRGDLVLSTAGHPALQGVLDGAVVSFQVDDPATGDRVVVLGRTVQDADLVRLRPEDVLGYRVPLAPAVPAGRVARRA